LSQFTYPEVGATGAEPLPPGYNHLHHRTLLGHGRAVLEAAGEAVLTWRMHRAVGVGVRADAERAAPGVLVEVTLGPGRAGVRAPCRVVRTVTEADRIGFAYGTLAGHPTEGEESFLVEMGDDKAVWFTVTAFSRPARWYTRALGPAVPLAQKLYAQRCGQVLQRLAASGAEPSQNP
jgi:uncharacterized protein (UPF0548 family)